MVGNTASLECLDCGHVHELAIVRGETAFEDYCEAPEACEACGAPLDDDSPSEASLQASERRQMGITS